jgi:transglutaminase-like putative cysteine protease
MFRPRTDPRRMPYPSSEAAAIGASPEMRMQRQRRVLIALLFSAGLAANLTAFAAPTATKEPAAATKATPDTASAVATPEPIAVDNWYIVELMDQPAGWMRTSEHAEGNTLVSESTMRLRIKRGPISMEIAMDSRSVEHKDGTPISMRSVQRLGAAPVTHELIFGHDSISMISEEGGRRTRTERPLPKTSWLPPIAAERYVRTTRESGAEKVDVATIDPSSGPTPVTMTRTNFRQETIDINGVPTKLWRNDLRASVMPDVPQIEWYDDDWKLVRSETQLGGMSLATILTTREKALEGSEKPAPELMVSTFVEPDRTIPAPRKTTRGVYTLSLKNGAMPELPSTGAQRVERLDNGSLRITIDTAAPAPATKDEIADAEFLAANVMINIDDEKIRELSNRGAGKADTSRQKAENLRQFVFKFINKKALGVGFGSASEVARTSEGDCTEHAVLLAALLRAQGIPARVATGLIYADQFAGMEHIFGYHAWAQALLEIDGEKRWIDLDATLPASTPTDATHITIAVTSLADGDMARSMATVAPLLGSLSIKVEEVK